MSGAAAGADAHRLGRQQGIGRGGIALAEREERPDDAIRLPLVIDETSGTEFGKSQETGALQISLAAAAIAGFRQIGHERQTREVVSGEKAFGGEVSIGVEVREGAGTALQQIQLVEGLAVAHLRGALFLVGGGVVIEGTPGRVALLLGGSEKVTPAIKSVIEAARSIAHERIGKSVAAVIPGCGIGCQFVCH